VKVILEYKKELIVKKIFTTPDQPVYTFDGFLKALEDVSTNSPDGLVFYLGQDSNSNLGHGIANIAVFLAHAATRGKRCFYSYWCFQLLMNINICLRSYHKQA
jgi:hypothetical protein